MYLHEPICRHLRQEHLGNQRKGLVKRLINAGNDQQEHEQHHEADLSGEDHACTGKDRRRNTKAHDHTGRIDKNAVRQFCMDHSGFMVIDFIIQRFQKPVFLIGRPDLPDVFQSFLNTVGYLNGSSFCDFRITRGHLPASKQQQKCHRYAPEAGNR